MTAEADGLLLLDKPTGMSSNAALQRVRRLFGRAKGGHTGTLDPLASGLLPVCLGAATRFAMGLLDADKTYEAVVRLGVATTTGDAEGQLVFETDPTCCIERVPEVLAAFTGEIEQMPPMFSAIKYQGRPLYDYARAGQSVVRLPRRVTIQAVQLLSISGAEVVVRVRCSKGTYIRALANDVGERLGCGAHLTALRRTAVGRFVLEQAIPLDLLEQLTQAQRLDRLLPPDAVVAQLPAVTVDRVKAEALLQGQAIAHRAPTGALRLYAEGGEFLGIGVGGPDTVSPRRMWVRRNPARALAEADLT